MAGVNMDQTKPPAAAMKPLNILIVDDSATMRALLHRVVGLADLPIGTIYQAPNGLEALKILETCSVQAVFTDLNMPVMNGMQLLREMAKRDSWKDLLRIIISTDGSKLRRDEARELNVNLYVEKPFRPEVVRDVLCQIASADAF
jgi:two-component system, chemotaxis family, chemotaxis protein CheY